MCPTAGAWPARAAAGGAQAGSVSTVRGSEKVSADHGNLPTRQPVSLRWEPLPVSNGLQAQRTPPFSLPACSAAGKHRRSWSLPPPSHAVHTYPRELPSPWGQRAESLQPAPGLHAQGRHPAVTLSPGVLTTADRRADTLAPLPFSVASACWGDPLGSSPQVGALASAFQQVLWLGNTTPHPPQRATVCPLLLPALQMPLHVLCL